MTRVYRRHLQELLICGKGARGWWARHGLDWADFQANGIDSAVLGAIDDQRARDVVALAESEDG